MSRDLVADFMELFEGRKDAYGADEGGCVRATFEPFLDWRLTAEAHLNGTYPIGVYPMVECVRGLHKIHRPFPSHVVKWGCVDFDVKTKGKPSWDYYNEEAAHDAACDLQNALSHVGVTSWIERTRSCGRHVWIFSETWCSARSMRRALLTACAVAGVSSREVNPKSEELGSGQLGNYVRLPYPGAYTPNVDWDLVSSRYMIVDGDTPLGLAEFVSAAPQRRTPVATIERVAALYKEPPKPRVKFDPQQVAALQATSPNLFARLNRAAKHVLNNGPEDGDRSRGLGYLAYQARLSGLTQAETYGLLQGCSFNKFAGRSDEERRLSEIVVGAWQ